MTGITLSYTVSELKLSAKTFQDLECIGGLSLTPEARKSVSALLSRYNERRAEQDATVKITDARDELSKINKAVSALEGLLNRRSPSRRAAWSLIGDAARARTATHFDIHSVKRMLRGVKIDAQAATCRLTASKGRPSDRALDELVPPLLDVFLRADAPTVDMALRAVTFSIEIAGGTVQSLDAVRERAKQLGRKKNLAESADLSSMTSDVAGK